MEHKITVAGIGPGSPDYMLPAASRAIAAAKVLVGSKRALETLAPRGAETKVIDKDINSVMAFIEAKLVDNDVVVMVSGDPGFYSLLSALRLKFPPEKLVVIPGISSVQLAFARLAQVWQDAVLVSMHGRTANDAVLQYQPGKKLGVLTDNTHNPCYIAKFLAGQGWPGEAQVWLCANLSYEHEQIAGMTLQEAMNVKGFEHCVMVVAA